MTNNKTVLVVDDHMIMRKRLEMDLKAKGFNVIEAKNGEEAIKAVTEKAIDLILMDINFNGSDKDGVQISKEIREVLATSQGKAMKIICVSTDIDKGSNEVFDGFCSKPLKAEDFNTIRSALNNQ